MKYLLIEFEDEEYWIEVGTDGHALRQIVFDNEKNVHVSSLEDCLSEGPIDENDIEGKIKIITNHDFEENWIKATRKKKELWEVQKMKYAIGKEVCFRVAYNYPQGWVLKVEDLIGIYSGDCNLSYGQWVKGRILGYDEINMWVRISDINSI